MSAFHRVLAYFLFAVLMTADTIVAVWLLLEHGFFGLVVIISAISHCYACYMVGRCSHGR